MKYSDRELEQADDFLGMSPEEQMEHYGMQQVREPEAFVDLLVGDVKERIIQKQIHLDNMNKILDQSTIATDKLMYTMAIKYLLESSNEK